MQQTVPEYLHQRFQETVLCRPMDRARHCAGVVPGWLSGRHWRWQELVQAPSESLLVARNRTLALRGGSVVPCVRPFKRQSSLYYAQPLSLVMVWGTLGVLANRLN